MSMVTRILVALDGSPRAPGVVRAAHELSARFDAELFLLRVILIPPEFPAAARSSVHDDLPDLLTDAALRELEQLAQGYPRAQAHAPFVEIGQPWRVIIEFAKRLDVDLIVIGSHGYSGIDRLIGTTAARVANRSNRNVLVVHERARGAGGEP